MSGGGKRKKKSGTTKCSLSEENKRDESQIGPQVEGQKAMPFRRKEGPSTERKILFLIITRKESKIIQGGAIPPGKKDE